MKRKWMVAGIAAAMLSLGGCASFGPEVSSGDGARSAAMGACPCGCGMTAEKMAQGGCGMRGAMNGAMAGGQCGCGMCGAMAGGPQGKGMGHGMMGGPDRQGMGPGMMGGPNRQGMGPGMMGGGGLRDYAALDLTDEQRARIAEIRSGLRQQMVQARDAAQKRMDEVLTEEQRAKLRRGR